MTDSLRPGQPAADLRWTWTSPLGPRTYEHTLTLDAAGVTLVSGLSTPSEVSWSLVAAFREPHLISGLPPEVRFALVEALAARIPSSHLDTSRDLTRLAFWEHYERRRVQSETFAFVIPQQDREPVGHSFRLDGLGLHVPASMHAPAAHYLPDDVFVHGPPLPAVPRQARSTLRNRLFHALRRGHALRPEHSFPDLDHTLLAPQLWVWDTRSDGEKSVQLSPGLVLAGHQYGHDMGFTEYAPERVWSGAPSVDLGAPDAVERELLVALTAALVPPCEPPIAAGKEPPPALFALRRRVVDRAPWSCSRVLVFDDFSSIEWRREWGERAALGLYASLRPDAELPRAGLQIDRFLHQHCYNFQDDSAWLASDGTGVLLARYCFGAVSGDGVNDVFHVLPVGHRRVVFEICTDSSQDTLEVTLSADHMTDLEGLSDEVEAYFRCFDLGPAMRRAMGTRQFFIDHLSVTL